MVYTEKGPLSLTVLLFICWCLSVPAMAVADPKFIIGFPEDNMSNDWRAAQIKQIREELTRYPNVRFLFSNAGGSVPKNILDIDDMVQQGVQLLFLAPRNPSSLRNIVPELRKKGIFIVLLTRKLETLDYDVYISPDDFRIAYDAANVLAEKLNGSGRILMLEGVPTTTTAKRRKQGFLSGLENYPGIKVITKVANYSRMEAATAMEKLIESGKKFDAVYAHNDAMATGARLALKRLGRNPADTPIVGIDFLPETVDAIKAGEQYASFTYPTCGKEGVMAAMDLLNGRKVSRFISVPFQMVTKKNIDRVKPIY